MIGVQWRVKPAQDAPKGGIWLGAGGAEGDGIWLGTLAEAVTGRTPRVWLSTAKGRDVAVVGKRGSGKSFTLGVIAEGLASGSDSALGRQEHPRAVLLFDPLDVYWTTRYPVSESENPEAEKHFQTGEVRRIADARVCRGRLGARNGSRTRWGSRLVPDPATPGRDDGTRGMGVAPGRQRYGRTYGASIR